MQTFPPRPRGPAEMVWWQKKINTSRWNWPATTTTFTDWIGKWDVASLAVAQICTTVCRRNRRRLRRLFVVHLILHSNFRSLQQSSQYVSDLALPREERVFRESINPCVWNVSVRPTRTSETKIYSAHRNGPPKEG